MSDLRGRPPTVQQRPTDFQISFKMEANDSQIIQLVSRLVQDTMHTWDSEKAATS